MLKIDPQLSYTISFAPNVQNYPFLFHVVYEELSALALVDHLNVILNQKFHLRRLEDFCVLKQSRLGFKDNKDKEI